MSDIVWYGAGKNISDYEKEFLEETGYPTCICDKNVEKQGTDYRFCDGTKRRIISLKQIEEEYGDCEYWITLADHNIEAVYSYLIDEGISPRRLKLFGNREFRLGCENLNYYCYVGSENVKTCAHFPFTNHIGFQNNIVSEKDILLGLDTLENWRRETIAKLRNGEKTTCDGCSGLRWGVWTKEPRVRTFAVGPSFADVTRCNANCFYCNQNSSIHNPQNNNQKLTNYDVHKLASDYYDSIEEIILADGEPTICPSFKKTMELAEEKGWAVQLNTNAILYDEDIAEVIANKCRSFVAVSLDSGTSETYKKIKRVDRFDRVVNNLSAYGEKRCVINMKYILMKGYNDSVNEIQSFIDICKRVGCKHVTLSQNFSGYYDGVKTSSNTNMPEELFCLFSYFIARLQEENIHWDFQIEFISKHDYDRLEKLRR